jgi:hypothetical protein
MRRGRSLGCIGALAGPSVCSALHAVRWRERAALAGHRNDGDPLDGGIVAFQEDRQGFASRASLRE